MSTVVNLVTRTVAVGKKGLLWLGMALLVSIGLLGPSVPLAQAALWYVAGGGPPLDFEHPTMVRSLLTSTCLGSSLPILHGFVSARSQPARQCGT